MEQVTLNKWAFIFFLLFTVVAFGDGDYAKHEQSLAQTYNKIQNDESTIRDLIKEKNKATDPSKVHEIVDEIKYILKSRKESIAKYNKELNHVEYEHPGHLNMPKIGKKGDEKPGAQETTKIRYKRYDEKNIREFEDEVSKLLSTVYDSVKKKYNEN